MVCIKCGEEMNKGQKFCTKCGFNMEGAVPGRKFLKVTGILFVISGVYGVFGIIVFGSNISISSLSSLIIIFNLVTQTILSFILGISGVMYCKNIEKAKLLKYFSFIYIGYSVAYLIVIVASSFSSIDLVWIIISLTGFILPICYFIGASKNLKAKGGQ